MRQLFPLYGVALREDKPPSLQALKQVEPRLGTSQHTGLPKRRAKRTLQTEYQPCKPASSKHLAQSARTSSMSSGGKWNIKSSSV